MGRAKKQMTKAEFAVWLDSYIDKNFNGSRVAAAKDWDELPAAVYEVIGGRRGATNKILKAVGGEKVTQAYYTVGAK